jgi:hypothetical protein
LTEEKALTNIVMICTREEGREERRDRRGERRKMR